MLNNHEQNAEQTAVANGESSKLIGKRWVVYLPLSLIGTIVIVGVFGFVIPRFSDKTASNNVDISAFDKAVSDNLNDDTSHASDKSDASDVVGGLVDGANVTLDDLGIEYTGEGTVKLESITKENTKTIAPPLLNRAILIPSSFSADVSKIVSDNINKSRAELKADPLYATAWFDLGLQYKIINDYDGAREIWLYLHKVLPTQSITAINLGNTYLQDYKNYKLAEQYYLEGLERNQNCSMCYTGLYELYRYAYKTDTDLAEKTLLNGIGAIPDNVDFLITLAVYYKDTKQNEKAIKYYNMALLRPELKDNYDLKSALETEIKALQ